MFHRAAEKNNAGRFALVLAAAVSGFFPAAAAPNYFTRTWQVEQPEFAFGHGLSCTKSDFKNSKLAAKKISADGMAKVTFTVKNTCELEGDEVAQVYYRHVNSAVPQARLALCGFARVYLKRGESSAVTVEIPAARLRSWNTEKKQYEVEPGNYELLVGAAADDIRLKLPMTIAAR